MTCDTCGETIAVGAWPFCPHGRSESAVIADDIPGGMWVENGFPEPVKVYSHSEHRRLLAARGREIGAKWVPGDKFLTRWDTVDLDGARSLLERGAQATRARIDAQQAQQEFPITVTDVQFTEPR